MSFQYPGLQMSSPKSKRLENTTRPDLQKNPEQKQANDPKIRKKAPESKEPGKKLQIFFVIFITGKITRKSIKITVFSVSATGQ